MPLNPDRFLADLHRLRQFGASGVGKGVSRPAFTQAEMDARLWVADQMRAIDLDVRFDPVGNLFGIASNEKSLLLGSHSDSQPEGGWLDGALGVCAALEVARAAHEDGATPISVVNFQDEEGRFGVVTGSQYWSELQSLTDTENLIDLEGNRFGDLRDKMMAEIPVSEISAGHFSGFIELHIEQGPFLWEAGEKVGVVTDIVGIRDLTLAFEGSQNHAGTTPMNRRKDAVQAMMSVNSKLNERLPAAMGPKSVWTIGHILVTPNASSIVPGEVVFTVQWRDADTGCLDRMEKVIRKAIDEVSQETSMPYREDRFSQMPPVAMDARLKSTLCNSAEKIVPGNWRELPSGAVHDASNVANKMPVAMLFSPSINGISHDFAEDTEEADLVATLKVMADTAKALS